MRAWGSRYARLVFERCGRNKRAASRLLDISYHTLEAYLRYGDVSHGTRRRLPEWTRGASVPKAGELPGKEPRVIEESS